MPFDPLDHLDASLADFEHTSRTSTRSPAPTSHHPPGFPFGYPSTHHLPASHNNNNNNNFNLSQSTTANTSFLTSDTDDAGTTITSASSLSGYNTDLLTTTSMAASSTASAAGSGGGGYSPPAWRRLGNGDRSSGFWRKGGDNLLGYAGLPPHGYYRHGHGGANNSNNNNNKPRGDFDPDYDSAEDDDVMMMVADDDEDILAAAIRTRLPTGSMSPEKERSPEPEYARHQFHQQYSYHNNHAPKANGNGHAHLPENDFRIKSEEPSAEDMKATLAALPQKDDADNCKFHSLPLSPSTPSVMASRRWRNREGK